MFWAKYLSTLAIGTIAVYFLAPLAWERYRAAHVDDADEAIFEPGQRPAPRPMAIRPVSSATPIPRKSRPVAQGQGTPHPPRPPRPRASSDGEWHAPGSEVGDEPNPVSPPPAAPPAQGADGVTADNAPPPPAEPPRPPLSLEKIPPSGDEVGRWGVICTDCGAFKPDGKRLPKKAPGGILVEIADAVRTSKGAEMAVCRLWDGHRWIGPYLIASTDLLMFEGGRDGILAEDVDNLLEYYRLFAERAARKAVLEQAAVDANPHAAKLRELSKENNDLAARVAELTEKRDEAKGAARVKIADELRRLETTATRLNQNMKRQLDLYNKWKATHGQKEADLASDREYAALTRKLDALRPKVADFGVED